jgi:hypothetical protein
VKRKWLSQLVLSEGSGQVSIQSLTQARSGIGLSRAQSGQIFGQPATRARARIGIGTSSNWISRRKYSNTGYASAEIPLKSLTLSSANLLEIERWTLQRDMPVLWCQSESHQISLQRYLWPLKNARRYVSGELHSRYHFCDWNTHHNTVERNYLQAQAWARARPLGT